jgi:hypothetical protein
MRSWEASLAGLSVKCGNTSYKKAAMNLASFFSRLGAVLSEEWRELTTVNPSDRLWLLPPAAALSSGLPLVIAAYFNHMAYGLVGSLGGMVFLYQTQAGLSQRMITLMTCAFGVTACYALGLLSHLAPPLMIPLFVFIAICSTMVCRFFGMGPPGSLFFIMAAALGSFSPGALEQLPLMVGLVALGTMLACAIGFFYSVLALRLRAAIPAAPTEATFDFVIVDSVVIGAFVGLSLVVAELLQLQRAYWVPISCIAVMQAQSLRALWNKQLQRVLGTAVGLLVAWALLLMPLDKWTISLTIMALTFIIESVVVRHYGIATVFITPLTILLAESTLLDRGAAGALMQARLLDTVIGCAVGLAGGICLHHPGFRSALSGPLRHLFPAKMLA